MDLNKIYLGDNIETLKLIPDNRVDCCVTSPPYYGLRDYGTGTWVGGDPNCPHMRKSKQVIGKTVATGAVEQSEDNLGVGDAIYKSVCPLCGAVREDKQVGLEETPEEYIERLVSIFREVKRVLKDEGTLWVNIGDSYAGGAGRWGGTDNIATKQTTNSGSLSEIGVVKKWKHEIIKPKDLIGIPWMLAFALRADGWYLRQDIIWNKPSVMPEPVKDRCTKSHEYIFLLSKSSKYYFDNGAMQESTSNFDGTRNKRDVWVVNTAHYKEAHFATFPEKLIQPMILAGCPKGGVVLDPFMGSGTTGVVAKQNHRNYIGCELNEEYVRMAENRIKNTKKRLF